MQNLLDQNSLPDKERERGKKVMLIAIMPFVNKFTALNGRFHGCGLLMDILFLLEKKNTSMIKDSSWSHEGGCLLERFFNKSLGTLFFRRGQNTLKLKFTNATDAGNFECQVSTNPKISQIFKLTVVGINLSDFFLLVF